MKHYNKYSTIILLSKFIAVILVVTSLLFAGYLYKNDKKKCINPFEVKDFTSGMERVIICDNTFYRGSIKVVSKNEHPDLFEFILSKDDKPDKVKQYVRVFEKDRQEYISIKSLIDYTSWNNSAIGIYRKEGELYKLIFKKTFKDNPGRWVNITFGEDFSTRDPYFYLNQPGEGLSISGDIGYLGCYGRCRLLWWDYYDWDSDRKTFVLVNNKHPEEFRKLLENYKDFDKDTCTDETGESKSISELYPVRKNKKYICSDDAREPATTSGQAERLLQGMKAIDLIINGENISISQAKKIKIN